MRTAIFSSLFCITILAADQQCLGQNTEGAAPSRLGAPLILTPTEIEEHSVAAGALDELEARGADAVERVAILGGNTVSSSSM